MYASVEFRLGVNLTFYPTKCKNDFWVVLMRNEDELFLFTLGFRRDGYQFAFVEVGGSRLFNSN